MDEKLMVKVGLSTLDKPMTHMQAMRWGTRNMPKDLKRAGFETFVGKTTDEEHNESWFRINYGKR